MSKSDKKKTDSASAKVQSKTIKDFQELGKISVEDLNNFFDNDLMAQAARRRRD